jgi:hypothetical protein
VNCIRAQQQQQKTEATKAAVGAAGQLKPTEAWWSHGELIDQRFFRWANSVFDHWCKKVVASHM